MRHRLAAAGVLLGLLLAAPRAWSQPSAEWIRVAISREDTEVHLQVHGGFTISALKTGNTLQQGRSLPMVAVRAVPQGIALGGQILPVSGVRVQPDGQATVSLNGRHLRGALDIVRQKDQTLLVINYVALEDYLRGVLSKEAPDYWPPEALRAIAIAARTYALYQRFTKAPAEYDVTGDVMSQDYGGKSGEKHATTRAVDATAGLVFLYRGKLFPAFYHSTCGGMTEHARVMGPYDLEPLRGGIACSFCSASPFFRWQRRLTKADLGWALRKSHHGSIGAVSGFAVTKRTGSGRVQEAVVVGAKRRVRLTGFDLRALLGFEHIRSPLFTVTPVGDSFVLDGRGWGHGVGMCQFGAAELARRGFSAREILSFYYPGIDLVNVQELANRPIGVIGGTP